jgi:hypothetical protein
MVKVHQVFIGCPFGKAIRRNYDRLKRELESETPLHLILADTAAISSTDYLLEHITSLIRESAGCIFDATGGNPNVSLEVGIAHALPAEFILALNTRRPRRPGTQQPSQMRAVDVRPIISDLQGRNRIEYKSFPVLKSQLLKRFSPKLPYMGRWHEFKTGNASLVPHALKVFEQLRLSGRTLRPRVIALLDGSGIDPDGLLSALSECRLVVVKRGRHGGIYYPTK